MTIERLFPTYSPWLYSPFHGSSLMICSAISTRRSSFPSIAVELVELRVYAVQLAPEALSGLLEFVLQTYAKLFDLSVKCAVCHGSLLTS